MSIRLQYEKDPERLRQAALVLESENRRLTQQVVNLTRRLMDANPAEQASLQLRLQELEDQLAQSRRRLFGDSSERRPGDKPGAKDGKKPRRGHGPRAQPELPIVEQEHELDEADRTCVACGGHLDEMGDQAEESEEIDVIERRFVVVKHRRKKYRCGCNGRVETAEGPTKLIPGGRYSVGVAVEAAVSKYADHLPLERQVKIMAREGLVIDSQTLWDQLDALAKALHPAYLEVGNLVQAQPVRHADETPWRMLSGGKKRWQVWGLATADAVWYRIADSRSAKAAAELVGDLGGVLVTDGYGAYKKLARDGPNIILGGCWAHARRKYVEVEEQHPKEVAEILDLIGQLYAVEREVPTGRMKGEASEERLRLRQQLRDERSRPILDRIHRWAHETGARVLPRSGLGKAIRYMLDLWVPLTRFLDDPRIPLDNNAAERALRGVVVGRKNHYGSKSKRGAEVAAVLYTLIESCKLVGVEPKAYLRSATEAALRGERIALPHQVADGEA